ncbi:YdcF family protein [Bacillus sp. SN10]|uniref:YdcF family protein n=1 Tax=Bacillus sp. SN10 TaxID=2056493 RepID=UPI000C328986|nr:YdcF family protein [Bacillus sp. SN10]PKJ55672.1 YdcF family protein [Bacillus sp. SN10]
MLIFTISGFLLLVLFGFIFAREKRRISLAFILTSGLAILLLSFLHVLSTKELSDLPRLILLGIVFVLIPIGILFVNLYLLFNGKIMLQREGRRLGNLLSLLLSIAVFVIIGLGVKFAYSVYNPKLYIYYITIVLIFLYFAYIFMSYLIYATLYHFVKIKYTPDFIIVLGSGLIGGDRVPPLLGSRLDKGMEEYMKYNKEPKIIVSGGQGPDELVSEASAMKKYLVDKGMDEQDVLMEDKSRNTLQNMMFSKSIMDSIKSNHKSIFVTNNYHVLRASIYARLADLKCEGVGSKTATYYLPSAFLREYIGVLVMYKWWHVASVSLILLFIIMSL